MAVCPTTVAAKLGPPELNTALIGDAVPFISSPLQVTRVILEAARAVAR